MDTPNCDKRPSTDLDDEDNELPSSFKRRRIGDGHQLTSNPKRSQNERNLKLSHGDYIVGWVCALYIEMAAAVAMLDSVHDNLPKNANDSNAYVLGNIGEHNIVIASLPSDGYGTNNAATVAANMNWSFPSLRIRLIVGIGGGVPGTLDIRLGDVVVSEKVIQYDLGKTIQNGCFQRTGLPHRPPQAIRTAVTKLRADHESYPSEIPSFISDMLAKNEPMSQYAHPGDGQDWLFDAAYDHDNGSIDACENCNNSRLVYRPDRGDNNPRIHYGVVASGNQVIKHGITRDELSRELNAACFEMEAAGLMEGFPCLVVRGICDYADSHKNKRWQKYAAATAAAYAKELLLIISPNETQQQPPTATAFAHQQHSSQGQRQDLLDSLRFEQIDARQTNIKAAHARTCEWLLQHPDYMAWLDPKKFNQHNGFLWIKGKPGAGKSTIMKFAYSRAKQTMAKNEVIASFFFNARGDDLEKSTAGMYRSLLIQLLEKLPDLQEVLDNPYLMSQHQNCSPTWETETLWGLFSNAVEKLGGRRLTCFIDALDECDDDQIRAMIENFEDIGERATESGTKLYICFSSRHYPHIEIGSGQELILENQMGHGQDLEKYIDSKLKAGKGKLAKGIRNEVLQKAAGVFLWVVLVVNILNKELGRGRVFAMEKRLREIPAELSRLFKDILTRDQDNLDDLLLCVQWILYAEHPLKREEFYFAVVSGLEPEQSPAEWDPEYINGDSMNLFVLSSSKGLAEVTKSRHQTVQFIHESVRDFLIKDNGIREIWPDLAEDFQSLSHDQLKKCCYSYMEVDVSQYITFDQQLPIARSDEAKSLRQQISDKFPFLEYATRHIFYHANEAAIGLPQGDFVGTISLREWINMDNLFQKHEIRRHTQAASLMYILAENNFGRLIRTARQHNHRIHVKGERYRYPFFAALAHGCQDALEALLNPENRTSKGDSVSTLLRYGLNFKPTNGDTPLTWAWKNGHEEIVIQLLHGDTEMELKASQQQILDAAVQRGKMEFIQLLLDKGGSTNQETDIGIFLLSKAIGYDNKSMVQLLLDKGADISRVIEGKGAIQTAVQSSDKSMIQLLLDNGADINQVMEGKGALQTAVQSGDKSMIQFLLEKKAKVDRRTLKCAIIKGSERIVRLLLDNVAYTKEFARVCLSLLDFAIKTETGIIVQLLLDRSAPPGPKSKTGETTLETAINCWSEDVIRWCLDKGVFINAGYGWLALLRAIENGQNDMVKLLLDRDVGVTYAGGGFYRTPLMRAIQKRDTQILRLLLDKGADVDVESDFDWTPLRYVLRKEYGGHGGHGRRRLFESAANIQASYGEIPWGADFRRYAERYRILPGRGADANTKDKYARTPLDYAIQREDVQIVQLLTATKEQRIEFGEWPLQEPQQWQEPHQWVGSGDWPLQQAHPDTVE
ncbi:hypothetical protein AAE478_006167 [Parahypoxylon ruwenzoriense]